MPLTLAIIGAGPSGFYACESLLKIFPESQIDIIERLPTPFGLIRGGVAPDHQSTKKVARKLEKSALMNQVNYYGNIEVNKDIRLIELQKIYDVVVIAMGAPKDKELGVPGSEKKGVIGSGAFVGWYNGHPDFRNLNPNLNVSTVAVIGNGNVALDVARVLCQSKYTLSKSDAPLHVIEHITSSPLNDVYIFGRRGPTDAKFSNVELREIGEMDCATPIVKTNQLPTNFDSSLSCFEEREQRIRKRNLKTFMDFSKFKMDEVNKQIHFEFFATPVSILGDDNVEGLELEHTRIVNGHAEGTGKFYKIKCELIVSAIGYQATKIAGAPFDKARSIVTSKDGKVANGLYAVGWSKRGASGVISSNRPDARILIEHIKSDFSSKINAKPGRKKFESILRNRKLRWVTYSDWKKIEAIELAGAINPAPRKKLLTVKEMLGSLDMHPSKS